MNTAAEQKLALQKWHEDAAQLRDLMHHSGWDTLTEYWGKETALRIEELLTNTPAGPPTDWKKGYIAGLRKAAQIPAEVLKNVGLAKVN